MGTSLCALTVIHSLLEMSEIDDTDNIALHNICVVSLIRHCSIMIFCTQVTTNHLTETLHVHGSMLSYVINVSLAGPDELSAYI